MGFFKKKISILNSFLVKRPLPTIIILGLVFRFLAVIFSKGFGMHDDHFLTIQPAQDWLDGHDGRWLPKEGNTEVSPSGHSFFYAGIHFILFYILKIIGITGAQTKMYIVRLLHALLSLFVVVFGYKIANKVSDQKTATGVGLLLSLYWFMPFLSVRNLVEVVCIAPLMYATWLIIISPEDQTQQRRMLLAGIILGIAFSIRFQTVLFAGGMGLALILQRRMWQALMLCTGFLFCVGVIQGLTDYLIWGVPFVEFKEYVRYNLESAGDYGNFPWYNYLMLIMGILVPPVSFFLIFGFLKSWKKYLLLFMPSFIFLLFHSYFPNKQERFILPIVPFVITLGLIGWNEFVINSNYWKRKEVILKKIWVVFWIVNSILLLVVSVAYSKRDRVEAMCFIAHKRDITSLIIEDSNRDNILMPPLFYLEKSCSVYGVTKQVNAQQLFDQIKNEDEKTFPNYVVFMQETNLEKRVSSFRSAFGNVEYETTIEPSFIDKLMHWLNPVNKNQVSYVYKIYRVNSGL